MNRQSTHWLRSRAWLAAGLAGLALSGCVVAPVGEPYYDSGSTYYDGGTYSDGYYGGTYYPAMPAEVVPVMPFAGAIWINGYWDTGHGPRRWVPGRYERPGWRPDNRPGWRPNDRRPDWNRPDRRPNANQPGWNRPDRRPDVNRPSGQRPDGHYPGWNRPNARPPNSGAPRPPGRMENPYPRSGPISERNPSA